MRIAYFQIRILLLFFIISTKFSYRRVDICRAEVKFTAAEKRRDSLRGEMSRNSRAVDNLSLRRSLRQTESLAYVSQRERCFSAYRENNWTIFGRYAADIAISLKESSRVFKKSFARFRAPFSNPLWAKVAQVDRPR